MGKGIVFSLLANVTVLPCLILISSRFADKYRHKPVIPGLKNLSGRIVRYRWLFLVIIMLIAVPSFLAQRNLDYYYSTEHYLPENSRAVVDTIKIRDTFMNTEVLYVITPDTGNVKEKELAERIKPLMQLIQCWGLSQQVDVAIPETFIPADVRERYIKEGYRYFEVRLSTPSDDYRTFEAVDQIRKITQNMFDESYVTGLPALTRDLASLSDTDMRTVSAISIGLILVILAISFKSLSIPFLLVLVIEIAIWINLSIPYLQNTTVSSFTSIVINAIQLGATVDYAILFTSRYRENLGTEENKLKAVRQTIEDTGPSILTSALTMIAATMGIALIASIKATGELTMMIGRGAAVSMLVIFLGLPSVFLIFDKIIKYTTIGWGKTEN